MFDHEDSINNDNKYFEGRAMNQRDAITSAMARIAEKLLGKPNTSMSTPGKELRFGSNGSVAINVRTGAAYDFASEKGGGAIWLIQFCTGKSRRDSYQWLIDNHFVEDQPNEAPRSQRNPAQSPRKGSRQVESRSRPVAGRHEHPVPAAQKVPAQPARHEPGSVAAAHGAGRRAGRWDFLNLAPDAALAATYDYLDENGELSFQVCRFEYAHPTKVGETEKSFRQRRPDPSRRDGWAWDVKGKVKIVPYRLPEVIEAMAQGRTVYVLEGEKDVDNAWAQGLPATCNPGGAGKFPPELVPYFSGADVVIVPDNDPQKRRKNPDGSDGEPMFHDDGKPMLAGQDHARLVADMILPVASRVRVLELARHCAAMPKKGDLSDWFALGNTSEFLFGLLPAAIDARLYDPSEWFLKSNYRPHFKIETWADLWKPGPKHEWLVKNVISKGEISMMAGASGSGKSFLTIDLCMAICRQTAFLGHKVVQRGAVIYQAGEGYLGLRSLRLPAYAQANGIGHDADVPFYLLGSPVDLWGTEDDTESMIADIQNIIRTSPWPVVLIVIDTLAAAIAGANENASEDVGRALKRCNRIREATGAAVLLVHHMNASGEKYRGWTGLGANVETVLLVKELDGVQDEQGRKMREIEVQKQKDGAKPRPHRYVLKGVTIGYDEDNEPVTSCVIEQPHVSGFNEAAPLRPSLRAIKLSPQAKIALDCIERAVISEPMPPPENNDFRPGMGGTSEWAVRKLFAQKMGTGGKDEDPKLFQARLRKAWERQRDYLQSVGLIEVYEDYLWRTKKGLMGSLFDPDRDAGPDVVAQVAGDGDELDVNF